MNLQSVLDQHMHQQYQLNNVGRQYIAAVTKRLLLPGQYKVHEVQVHVLNFDDYPDALTTAARQTILTLNVDPDLRKKWREDAGAGAYQFVVASWLIPGIHVPTLQTGRVPMSVKCVRGMVYTRTPDRKRSSLPQVLVDAMKDLDLTMRKVFHG